MAFHPTGIAAMHRTGIAYRPGIVIVSNQIVIAGIHGTGLPQNLRSIELFLHRTGNSAIASKWRIVQLRTGIPSNWQSVKLALSGIPSNCNPGSRILHCEAIAAHVTVRPQTQAPGLPGSAPCSGSPEAGWSGIRSEPGK